jgi:predicted lipid-binding transport protein (Tim44 family)
MSEDRNILNFIRSLCDNGESGRLELLAGSIQGELSFAGGKLVDARFGHLTGFRAVNAVAAMRDARFSFDPAFTPLASSSITASERVVLKQFFGIETATTSEYLQPAALDWPEEEAAAAPAAIVADAPDEVTIVRSDVSSSGNIPIPPPQVSLPPPAPRSPYRTALALAVLAMAVMAAAAVLIYRFRHPGSATVVASAVESPSRPEPVQPQPEAPSRPEPAQQPKSPVGVQSKPAHSVPAPAAVKEGKKPLNAVQDLSGKWNVVNSVETTAYSPFKNMKIGFDLSIDQTGSTFTGRGRKISENGRSLPANSRTPIQVKGSINGDRIEATFIEEGSSRKSAGKFVWRIDRAGRGLTGTFGSTAARSSGKSAAIRM